MSRSNSRASHSVRFTAGEIKGERGGEKGGEGGEGGEGGGEEGSVDTTSAASIDGGRDSPTTPPIFPPPSTSYCHTTPTLSPAVAANAADSAADLLLQRRLSDQHAVLQQSVPNHGPNLSQYRHHRWLNHRGHHQ